MRKEIDVARLPEAPVPGGSAPVLVRLWEEVERAMVVRKPDPPDEPSDRRLEITRRVHYSYD